VAGHPLTRGDNPIDDQKYFLVNYTILQPVTEIATIPADNEEDAILKLRNYHGTPNLEIHRIDPVNEGTVELAKATGPTLRVVN
jgi:hypothetical protein